MPAPHTPPRKRADLSYLLEELRRIAENKDREKQPDFFRVMREHLRDAGAPQTNSSVSASC